MVNNKEKIFSREEHRTNPLSKIDGGDEIEIHYRNYIKVYNNVKHPKAYINAIKERDKDAILAIFVNGFKTKFI